MPPPRPAQSPGENHQDGEDDSPQDHEENPRQEAIAGLPVSQTLFRLVNPRKSLFLLTVNNGNGSDRPYTDLH